MVSTNFTTSSLNTLSDLPFYLNMSALFICVSILTSFLIPAKKSLHLAEKSIDYRKVRGIMAAFAEIGVSPVTISKRHDIKKLDSLYSYFEIKNRED